MFILDLLLERELLFEEVNQRVDDLNKLIDIIKLKNDKRLFPYVKKEHEAILKLFEKLEYYEYKINNIKELYIMTDNQVIDSKANIKFELNIPSNKTPEEIEIIRRDAR